MDRFYLILLLSIYSILSLSTIAPASAVTYRVINSAAAAPGGVMFNRDIGEAFAVKTLQDATSFIWRIFRQGESDRKKVDLVTLFIEDIDGIAFTVPGRNEIHVSAKWINTLAGRDVRREFAGVLYHEDVHVWQWFGASPSWVFEGVADYVRLKAGYIPAHWVQPGGGNSWTDSYDKTARFYEYLERRRPGFVAELNARLKVGYKQNDGVFVDIMGKTVQELWREYKAAYGRAN